jgi:hypothetical protein
MQKFYDHNGESLPTFVLRDLKISSIDVGRVSHLAILHGRFDNVDWTRQSFFHSSAILLERKTILVLAHSRAIAKVQA